MDEQALRVLAHPIRSRILHTLRTHGPGTSADLARALDTNTGATSYHVRRLGEVGLVQESGPRHGRQRRWAATDIEDQPAAGSTQPSREATLAWLERDVVHHLGAQAERWLGAAGLWPQAWRRATTTQDAVVLVTAAQLEAMHRELAEVLARYRRVGQGNPEAKRVAIYTVSVPLDLQRRPG